MRNNLVTKANAKYQKFMPDITLQTQSQRILPSTGNYYKPSSSKAVIEIQLGLNSKSSCQNLDKKDNKEY